MVTEKTTSFGGTLLATVGFTLALMELLALIPALDEFSAAAVLLACFFAIPTVGGLTCRAPRVAVYISMSSSFSLILINRFFPLRGIDVLGTVARTVLMISFLSIVCSFVTYNACIWIGEWRAKMFRVTKTRSLLLLSSLGLIAATLVILTLSESIYGYFERHPWVVTLVIGVAGIVTNALWFVLGRKRYGRKKHPTKG